MFRLNKICKVISTNTKKYFNNSQRMAENVLEIDGGVMEGGGQILRMATAFSILLQKPIRIYNIRAKRDKPGLRPQHLSGLLLARDICNGDLSGAAIGSTEIQFKPGKILGGRFFADPQTAGSVTLLFQVAFPCLLFAPQPTELHLRGGTNVDFAPPIDHTLMVFKPAIEKFGVEFDCDVKRRGYFPKGGGEVIFYVIPVKDSLKPIEITDCGDIVHISGRSFVAGVLPMKMAYRMGDHTSLILRKDVPKLKLKMEFVQEPPNKAFGNGNGIMLCARTSTDCLIGSSSLGNRNKDPETVGEFAANDLVKDINSLGCVDSHMQDQMIIFMVLAKGISRLHCGPLTLHTETAIHVAELFTEAKFNIKQIESGGCTIECHGIGLCKN